ncbi:related to OPY2 protein [Cephalotrichum gorgonifer]|uniref:Related to OPY2 protein n=1 Tax=Cephalotrichum gorgonifer TaxID=2041049 RepID=A0AAE8MPY4_9PEZI|nr:related to OPY2 protein [Cephalotrichum gorgonifer]
MDEEYNPYLVITSDDDVFREALRARDLFPRDDPETCVKCSEGRLVCDASCKEEDGWVCKQVVKVDDCKECPTTKCVQQAQSDSSSSGGTSSSNTSSGPNTGVIVGAVIGGVVGIAAITYLIWRFCIKNKRQPIAPTSFDDISEQKAEEKDDFQTRRGQRESMHTIHSIASTVLTRASNIIQIAYIPGVTNRTTPTSPNVLVPPVPPIPIGISGANSPGNYEDQHFFMPGDLRDSTYSAMTGYTDRTSFARTSYAPRSSVASTIYGKNAVVSTPQTGMRAKPAMISVRSGGTGSSGTATPPVPNVDYEKYNPRPKSRDSTFSIGSAFMKNASAATATPVKAQLVRVASGKRVNVKSGKSDGGASPNPSAPSTRSPLAHTSGSPTIVEDSQSEEGFEGEGPFLDPPESAHDRLSHSSSPSLSAVIEEATRRAAHVGKPNSMARETSPFGDEHATKD